ncbi:MAG: hypothetical protein JWM40_1920 [Frankiales bacterium]|nr:hypothetical protein [Frankiales bacterium]
MAEDLASLDAPQERHAFRLSPLIFGLLTVTASGLFLLDDQGAVNVDSDVVGAALLLVVGAASVIRAVVHLRSKNAPG